MAVLNNFQKFDYVAPGMPFGDGANGSATISSDPNTRATLIGTATQSTATIGSAILSNGDLVVCHQTQGTGAGNWQVNKVASGGGTTSITFTKPNNYTYATGAQIIKVPRYSTATVSAHSVTAWNGTVGGIEVICAKTSITVSGALNGASAGFRGGAKSTTNGAKGIQGESYSGSQTHSVSANYSGGGGGNESPGGGGGGGTAGETYSSSVGGALSGIADLTVLVMGGGGGGGEHSDPAQCSNGGIGGSIIILLSKSIILNSSINIKGQVSGGTGNGNRSGGCGGGGNCLLVCESASLATNNIDGSVAVNVDTVGADGGIGRIAIHHSGTVTGTSNPTFTDVSDATLVETILNNSARFYFM